MTQQFLVKESQSLKAAHKAECGTASAPEQLFEEEFLEQIIMHMLIRRGHNDLTYPGFAYC